MSTLVGTINQIPRQFKGAKRYFYLDTYDPSAIRDNTGRVRCLAAASKIFPNMPVKLNGEYVDNVFECNSVEPIYITKNDTVKYLHTKVKGSGIGIKKIDKMVSLYGSRVFEFEKYEFHDNVVKDFPEINEKSLNKFLECLYRENPISEIEEFLSPYPEIPYPLIEKISLEYGIDAVDKFKTNPYAECVRFDIKRKVAEKIAYSLKIEAFDKRRIDGLIKYALKDATSSGHTYMKACELANKVSNWSDKSVYKEKIPAIYVANMVATSRKYCIDKQTGYIGFKYLINAETNIAIRLNALNEYVNIKDKVSEKEINDIEKESGITFAKEQKESFYILNDNGVSILTGGPGTGKTSTINGIIAYYLKKHPNKRNRIKLAAPTGRAAARLTEATGFEATTIHRLLEFRPYSNEIEPVRNINNPIDADFLIIDEMSMCDVSLLNILVNAIPVGCRVLFVGDEDQMPSVGPGNCLHDIILSGRFNIWRLIKNFRSDSSIYTNSIRVLNGEEPKEDKDFFIKKAKDEEDAYNMVVDLMEKLYDKKDPFMCQVIEPSNKGTAGTYKINSYVHKNIVHKDLGSNISSDFMVGDKIIFNVNNYEKVDEKNVTLYTNGEVGLIKYIDDTEFVFDNGLEEKVLPVSCLIDASLCYAYTIHKSQGSENDIIIICLPESVNYMMNRNLLYTAITRAKKKVIIIYTGDALKDCIDNVYKTERCTRLAERLA